MKRISVYAAMLLCLCLAQTNAHTLFPSVASSIVITDDSILITQTGNPSENIVSIQLHDGATLITTMLGCKQPKCSNDLSGIASGSYQATVFTDAGNQFSSMISIR
ncbi:MAG: hypothetical protein AAF798_10260 [Bacteroidota bacterium]